jgi:hypothetical protein
MESLRPVTTQDADTQDVENLDASSFDRPQAR